MAGAAALSARTAAMRDSRPDIRARADTIYHPVGTCRMGRDDYGGDSTLRGGCTGWTGLRVVDASLMPRKFRQRQTNQCAHLLIMMAGGKDPVVRGSAFKCAGRLRPVEAAVTAKAACSCGRWSRADRPLLLIPTAASVFLSVPRGTGRGASVPPRGVTRQTGWERPHDQRVQGIHRAGAPPMSWTWPWASSLVAAFTLPLGDRVVPMVGEPDQPDHRAL